MREQIITETLSMIFAIIVIALAFTACKKEGTGGKVKIHGHVKHHDLHIPGAIVYIKYGAEEFPGTNTSDYDNSTIASSGDGHYKFTELLYGDYYLYSIGYDSAILQTVRGGTPVKIPFKDRKKTTEVDVPVTE